MSDVIQVMSMMGILPYVVGVIVAFGSIALYFGFIKKL